MIREEQLKEYLKERNIPIDSLEANSIREGIEWADKHPKEGLVSIDKAEKWLCKYFVEDNYGMSPSGFGVFMHMFKQGLEE